MDKVPNRKPRINASLLPHHRNSSVCMLGQVVSVDSNGMCFHILSSDNQKVTIRLREPLREKLTDLVEVHGTVQGNEISCSNYVCLHHESSEEFDMNLYDKVIRMVHKYPEHYITM